MKQQEVNHNFYFVASTEKRLFWKTDKEQILHILSRVNIKYLRSLINQCRAIQNYDDYLHMESYMRTSPEVAQAIVDTRELLQDPAWKGNKKVEEFNQHRAEVYTDTKVWCKYDGYIFEVSFKTLKDEMKRRSKEGQK